MARTIASSEEEALYEALNRGLRCLRGDDVAGANRVLAGIEPRMVKNKPHRSDVAAIARLKKEIDAVGLELVFD